MKRLDETTTTRTLATAGYAVIAMFALGTAAGLTACDTDEGPLEETAESVEEAGEEAGDAAENAAEEAEDAVD